MDGDELDRMLDDALASYSLQEPRAGLSGRVTARVRSEGAATRRYWLLFSFAAAAVACLAVAMVMWRGAAPARQGAIHEPPAVVVKKAAPVPGPSRREEPRRPVRTQLARTLRLPQRDGFPSPVPLSGEERALLAFVQQAPDVAREMAKPDEPVEIEAINIQPLQIDSLSTGESR